MQCMDAYDIILSKLKTQKILCRIYQSIVSTTWMVWKSQGDTVTWSTAMMDNEQGTRPKTLEDSQVPHRQPVLSVPYKPLRQPVRSPQTSLSWVVATRKSLVGSLFSVASPLRFVLLPEDSFLAFGSLVIGMSLSLSFTPLEWPSLDPDPGDLGDPLVWDDLLGEGNRDGWAATFSVGDWLGRAALMGEEDWPAWELWLGEADRLGSWVGEEDWLGTAALCCGEDRLVWDLVGDGGALVIGWTGRLGSKWLVWVVWTAPFTVTSLSCSSSLCSLAKLTKTCYEG